MDDKLGKKEIEKYLGILNDKLEKEHIIGEVVLFGGAVMCFVFDSREQTKDIDAVYYPKEVINRIVQQMATEYGLRENWFNDAVKGFLSSAPDLQKVKDYGSLIVYSPSAEYVFAMKCYACRILDEKSDIDDIRFLLKYLKINNYDTALKIIGKYYGIDQIPVKVKYVLEQLIGESS